jgi:CRP-like cAMP-binding protein
VRARGQELRREGVFADLSEPELAELAAIARPRKLKAGQTLMAEGEGGTSMFVLCEGTAEVSRALVLAGDEGGLRDDEKVLDQISAGGEPVSQPVLGEMALFCDAPRSATVTALTDCLLCELEREAFLGFIEERPALGVKVLRRLSALLSERLKKTGDDVVRLTTAFSIALSG